MTFCREFSATDSFFNHFWLLQFGGNFGIRYPNMSLLSLQMPLLERVTGAENGMGVGAFCLKEVA